MKRRFMESDGNGGHWISNNTIYWAIGVFITLVTLFVSFIVQFTSAQNDIAVLKASQERATPQIQQMAQEVAVLKDHVANIDKNVDSINKNLDKLASKSGATT